ncbi:MAG: hypothetical protein HYX54_03290 [Chloroflexi bacterium]|nr:hypothetical protein [Chloroflexota bacterium]
MRGSGPADPAGSREARSPGSPPQSVPNDETARPERVAVVPAVDREQIGRHASERLVAAHARRHLADRCERDLVVLRRDRAAVDSEASRLCPAGRGPDQSSLAEPRLPRQEQRSAAPAGGLGDQVVDQLEQVVTTDEDRAADGPDTVHRQSLWPRGKDPSVG